MYSDNIKSVLRSLASSGSVGKQERVSRLFKSYNPHKSQLKSYNPHQSQQRSVSIKVEPKKKTKEDTPL
ncbi:hypothetical protein ABKV19_022875 [Rosa sericea]